jgi:hypothetical protein
MILEAIGQRILSNPTWQQAIYDAALTAWRQRKSQHPTEQQHLKTAVEDIDRRIARLVDSIENGVADVDVKERLDERRREKAALAKQLDQARRIAAEPAAEPTMAWIVEQLQNLSSLLHAGGPAAALALRELVGGKIVMRDMRKAVHTPCHMQGRFVVRTSQVLATRDLAAQLPQHNYELNSDHPGEEIVIDFREPQVHEQIADQVKELWDAGKTYREIADVVGRNRNLVAKALALWFQQRGMEVPKDRPRSLEVPTSHNGSQEALQSGEKRNNLESLSHGVCDYQLIRP